MLLSKAAGNHSGLNTAAYKSLVSVCTMKPFADPGPEENAKFASCSYNGYNGHTAAATAWVMRQLLPVCIRIPPPWIIHISLMLRVQCHATPGVTCHVSRARYEVYTRSRHSAIPPQPSQRPQPGHLSKTSSNLIQFMCCGKIRNHKWKASDVFKKQSYPGWCIVNGWVWKLQARWRYQAISGINYVSVWLDKADSVACVATLWHGTCRIIIAQRLNATNCCSLCGLMLLYVH